MKKKICLIFSLFLICLLSLNPVYAASTQLKDMEIQVYINDDGSAHIQEVWDMKVNTGTEIYKVFNNMAESQISNLKVKDDSGHQYKNIGEWDVDASKSEKDKKCGLVTKDEGYELCFGIGNYGTRTYTFEYDISHFVKQYTNDQGFNFAFFSELSLEPERAKITISSSTEFNKDNSQIWAFGYYGDAVFKDGKVVMESTETVPQEGKMQLLMRMNNGTFVEAYPTDQDFEAILADAKEGSDYRDTDYGQGGDSTYSGGNSYGNGYSYSNSGGVSASTIVFAGVGMIAVMIIFVTAFAAKSSSAHFVFNDHVPMKAKDEVIMFRDIPCDKDLFMFYYFAKKFGVIQDKDRGGMVAAILLKWIQKGYINFEKREEKKMGIFKKDGFSIDLNKEIVCTNPCEQKLLNYFRQAAGSNIQLETKEFERWCKQNYQKVDEWFEGIDTYMTSELQTKGMLKLEKAYKKVLGIRVSYTVDCYDASIREETEHIIGLKKFLEEMSLIDEKEVIEVKMWEEYLIYASILGIADRVQEQLGEMCPTFNQQSQLDTIYTMHMIHMFSYSSMRASYAASEAARSDGFGGGASFGGGGGGFSGGGGGGVR